jgi:hypothetical protein
MLMRSARVAFLLEGEKRIFRWLTRWPCQLFRDKIFSRGLWLFLNSSRRVFLR